MQAIWDSEAILLEIKQRLSQAIKLDYLHLDDESEAHLGHSESPNRPLSHLHLIVVSEDFAQQTPLKRHQCIYAALGDLLGSVIHAVRIEARSPQEWKAKE